MKKKRTKINYLRWSIGLVIIVLISSLTWGAFSWAEYVNFLKIEKVNLTGYINISQDEYLSMLGDISNTKMSNVHLADIRNVLEAHPFVRVARVSHQYPNTINIELIERQPLALVNIDPLVMVDEDGVVLPEIANIYDFQIPCLSNFNPAVELYPVGSPALSQKVKEVTILLKQTRQEYPALYRNLSEIRLNRQDEFELILTEEPTRIALGTNRIWEKLLVLREFERTLNSSKQLTDYSYLDLRYKNQVIAKEQRL